MWKSLQTVHRYKTSSIHHAISCVLGQRGTRWDPGGMKCRILCFCISPGQPGLRPGGGGGCPLTMQSSNVVTMQSSTPSVHIRVQEMFGHLKGKQRIVKGDMMSNNIHKTACFFFKQVQTGREGETSVLHRPFYMLGSVPGL